MEESAVDSRPPKETLGGVEERAWQSTDAELGKTKAEPGWGPGERFNLVCPLAVEAARSCLEGGSQGDNKRSGVRCDSSTPHLYFLLGKRLPKYKWLLYETRHWPAKSFKYLEVHVDD